MLGDVDDVTITTVASADIIYWNGSAWVNGDHGNIGGLGDDDHPQYALKTLWSAKGSITAATAASTPADVTVGADGTVLQAASGQATGVAWVALSAVGLTAADIAVVDSGGLFTATDVEAALAETATALNVDEAALATHAGAADPHTGYRLESADHSHASTGLQGGLLVAANIPIVDAGLIITATDVEGALVENRAALDVEEAALVTHAAAADPHAGYRLESADHTHQSTGAQAGQLDHGLALTGLTDDDHTQYLLKSVFTTKGDILQTTAASTPARLAVGLTDGHTLQVDSVSAGGIKWAANPAGTAATTVTSETALDVAAAVGVATGYAREDHTHGTLSTATDAAAAVTAMGIKGAANPLHHDRYADSEAQALVDTHAAAGDPHTGYRLESEDHSHASTGLQGGATLAPTVFTMPSADVVSTIVDKARLVAETAGGTTVTDVYVGIEGSTQKALGWAADLTTHAAAAGAHHTKYTDAEAIAAVEGEATLSLGGTLDMNANSILGVSSVTGEAATQMLLTPGNGFLVMAGDFVPSAEVDARRIGYSGDRFSEMWSVALDVSGNITVGGTVDGVDIAARDHAHPEALWVATPADTAINVTSDATIGTHDVTGVAAGDQIKVDVWLLIQNNSTATRNYTFTIDFDAAFDIELSTGSINTHANKSHPIHLSAVCDIRTSGLAYMISQLDFNLVTHLSSGEDTTAGASALETRGWGTTASDLTGTTTVAFKARSGSSTSSQTLRLLNMTVQLMTPS